MKNILIPFIDATYYENVYKPVKTARISGTFTNVKEHKADFDPFINRASILVDRVLMNKISLLGGFDKMSDTFDKECIMQGTAGIVELWYIKGYTVADIDAALNIGGTAASKKANIKTFRDMLPFTTLALLQKTSMFNKQRLVAVDLEKELHDMGLTVTDILTWSDALAVFEQKGLSANFHIEGDLTPELSGLANVNKYILVASTPKHLVNMTIIGGTTGIAESTIRIERDDTGAITNSEALITSTKALADTPDFYSEIDGDKVNVYMKVADDQTNKTLVISNQFGDDIGEYGVLGSKTTSQGMNVITKTSVLGNQVTITGTTEAFVRQQDALLEGRIKTNIDANTRLAKKAEADAAAADTKATEAKAQATTNKDKITVLESDAATTSKNIQTILTDVSGLKSGGVSLGEIAITDLTNDIRELNAAFPNAKDGDYVEVITGAGLDLKYFTYTKAGNVWNQGTEKDIHLKGNSKVGITTITKDQFNTTDFAKYTDDTKLFIVKFQLKDDNGKIQNLNSELRFTSARLGEFELRGLDPYFVGDDFSWTNQWVINLVKDQGITKILKTTAKNKNGVLPEVKGFDYLSINWTLEKLTIKELI